MKIKTADLIGPALDWAVAKGESVEVEYINDGITRRLLRVSPFTGMYRPSVDWSQGGPLIEAERIKVAPNLGGSWHGQIRHTKHHPLVQKPVLAGWTNQHGPTPLVAGMRCLVASRLGDEVDVPDELV